MWKVRLVMSDELAVSPDGLRTVSGQLAQTSAAVKKVLAQLNSNLDAEGPAWGDDATGDGFAAGPSGYLAQMDWVNESVKAKTDLLDGYSQAMTSTANTLQSQDES
jgi:uncharacterized protein YukE